MPENLKLVKSGRNKGFVWFLYSEFGKWLVEVEVMGNTIFKQRVGMILAEVQFIDDKYQVWISDESKDTAFLLNFTSRETAINVANEMLPKPKGVKAEEIEWVPDATVAFNEFQFVMTSNISDDKKLTYQFRHHPDRKGLAMFFLINRIREMLQEALG